MPEAQVDLHSPPLNREACGLGAEEEDAARWCLCSCCSCCDEVDGVLVVVEEEEAAVEAMAANCSLNLAATSASSRTSSSANREMLWESMLALPLVGEEEAEPPPDVWKEASREGGV